MTLLGAKNPVWMGSQAVAGWDFEYHFDSDIGFAEIGTQFVIDTSVNNRVDAVIGRDGADHRLFIDTNDADVLGSNVSDTAWVMRVFHNWISTADDDAFGSSIYHGISSINDVSSASHDSLYLTIEYSGIPGDDNYIATEAFGETLNAAATKSVFAIAWTDTDSRGYQIARQSATSCDYSLYNNSNYDTEDEKETNTINALVDNLKFLNCSARNSTAKAFRATTTIDDYFLSSGVTVPP